MRLTDDPKRLAEMRPDVAWPADVQAVMDKALERDVAHRYQTASEFGRDLHKSVDVDAEDGAASDADDRSCGRRLSRRAAGARVERGRAAAARRMPSRRRR